MQSLQWLAVLAVLALSSCSPASAQTNSSTNSSTPAPKTTPTTFLRTEYNPDLCPLQLRSLECLDKLKNDKCGELNGYPLKCSRLGQINGKEKYACDCRANETDVCQGSTAKTITGAFQFDSCSDEKPCADTYGHVPSKLELRICAERLHCVKEINTTATNPAQICHTCRSCIAQNDAQGAQLADKRRFDCTKICPKSILDSLAARNKQNVSIADEIDSNEDSGTGSNEEEGSGTAEGSGEPGSGSKDTPNAATVSSSALVATIVATALSAVLLH